MKYGIEDYVCDILETAAERLGRRFNVASLSWISHRDIKAKVVDAAMIFTVKGEGRHQDAVLMVSNSHYPNFVADAVDGAKNVYENVQPSIQATVMLPEFHDRYGEQSFAIYPKLIPVSENRFVRRVQKHFLERRINEWLCDLCSGTKQPVVTNNDLEEGFQKPLSYLASESGFSDALRKYARTTLASIKGGDFQPAFTIQHGDFWLGNILLKRGWPFIRGEKYPFSVIDWGSANLKGYPFVDLLRYALSTTKNETRILENLQAYSRRSDILLRQLPNYACASIGWLGLHRNNFPMERYVASSEELFLMARRFGVE